MSKLTNTIRTEVDNDYFMDIADFRDYARSMMFPDPVGIDMSDEFDGFRYGQELLCFCDTETAAQRLGI